MVAVQGLAPMIADPTVVVELGMLQHSGVVSDSVCCVSIRASACVAGERWQWQVPNRSHVNVVSTLARAKNASEAVLAVGLLCQARARAVLARICPRRMVS